MPDVSIHIDHVSKSFPKSSSSSYLRFSELLTAAPKRIFNRLLSRESGPPPSGLLALDDVDIKICTGEIVGIIGNNGAGKSTLLKLLSKILYPTRGRIGLAGRVSSLLEVGTGFHPELTGRENIFLNGAILGMDRSTIRRNFDNIVSFAEIAPFIDTPVKHYSSGMYVRLAFAVAAHLQPEILLIDEVLAVGDVAFQSKCLGHVRGISSQGRTVIFVSHNLPAVTSLCTRAIHLDRGRVISDGSPHEVISGYLGETNEVAAAAFADDDGMSSELMSLLEIGVSKADGQPGPLTVRTAIEIAIRFTTRQQTDAVNVSLFLYDAQGTCIFNSVSPLTRLSAGSHIATVLIPGDFLNNGLHRVRVMLATDLVPHIDCAGRISFHVHDAERLVPVFGNWTGTTRPNLTWTFHDLNTASRVSSHASE